MAHNVEIKAYLQEPAAMRARVEKLADSGPTLIVQEDIFFHSRNGRLKLRKMDSGAELIYYEREDSTSPSESQYMKTAFADVATLEAMLSVALEIRGTVLKRRQLYYIGQTRVHIDDVEGLGSFIELEVELEASQSVEEGQAIADDLMAELRVKKGDLVAEAYIDLLEAPSTAPEE